MVSKTPSRKPTATLATAPKGVVKPGGKRPPVKPASVHKAKPGGPGKVSDD